MLFAMTSTLCAGRALPLPVHLKKHLVAGHVCDWGMCGERFKAWMWDGSSVCASFCVFADAMKASYMGHAVTGRAAVLVAAVCVHVRVHMRACVCLCACMCVGKRELSYASWLYLLCWDEIHYYSSFISVSKSGNREKQVSQYHFSTPSCYLVYTQRKRRWPPPLPHCPYCLLKCSRVPMKWALSNLEVTPVQHMSIMIIAISTRRYRIQFNKGFHSGGIWRRLVILYIFVSYFCFRNAFKNATILIIYKQV